MNPANKKPTAPKGLPGQLKQQSIREQAMKSVIAHSKKPAAVSNVRQPVGPPIHRPQSKPPVAQPKMTGASHMRNANPFTPAASRPQTVPGISRQQTRVQPQVNHPGVKKQAVGPPIYRPQTTPKVLQAKQRRDAASPLVKDAKSKPLPIRNPNAPPRVPVAGSEQVVQPAFWGLAAIGVLGLGALAVRSWNQFTTGLGEAAVRSFAFGAEMAVNEMPPFPHPVFQNRQAADYENERQEYLAYYEATRHLPEEDQAYIVTFQRNPETFRRRVLSKQKFLWALTVDGELCIGSPTNNKHAIVAGGKDVFAAGTGHLKVSDAEEQYLKYQYLLKKAELFRRQGKTDQASNPYIKMAADSRVERPPSLGRNDIVVLDFDSGHYHPSDAWRKTKIAWADAEFFVEVSTKARHV